MIVRDYVAEDAAKVVALYNNNTDNPNPVSGGITAEQFQTELSERGTKCFLIAEDDGQVVGTFGMFASNGRHSVGELEAFADMFFVAPSYRCTMLTGVLFAAAVEAMFTRGMDVLRLTVNPANAPAFKLYRRVGCVSLQGRGPGEDANVELHNYIPLILRTVRDEMGEEGRRILAAMTSFGCITQPLDDHLAADTIERDGRVVVDYLLDLGLARVQATIDVSAGCIVSATIVLGEQAHQVSVPGRTGSAAPTSVPEVAPLQNRAWTAQLDAGGAIALSHQQRHGAMLTTTWPSSQSHRAAGWRQGSDVHLRAQQDDATLRISDDRGLSCVVRAEPDGFDITYQGQPHTPLRLFQHCGLRQALLSALTADGQLLDGVSAGLNVAVRDASEITAASLALASDHAVCWQEGDDQVRLEGPGQSALVHSTLIDRRLELDHTGHATIHVHLEAGDAEADGITDVLPELTSDDERIVLKPEAGGISLWRDGQTKVLRAPWPRSQRIGSNPFWRAGLWVTREPDRHDRSQGMGWGLSRQGWQATEHGMRGVDDPIAWVLTGGPDTGWTVDVTSDDPRGELVVWLTPATPSQGRVMSADHQTTTVLDLATTWQRWATRAAIPLRHDRWLLIEPDAEYSRHGELLLRNTGQGLLVGCASQAEFSMASWRFAITTGLPAHNPRRNDYTTAS